MSQANWTYVSRLYEQLRQQLEGLHKKMDEVERLRYLEEEIVLPGHEKQAGVELRVGLTAELIENVKAAITTNPPKVGFKPLRAGSTAESNASRRAAFWNAFLLQVCLYEDVLDELADSTAGLGLGFLKASFCPWPKKDRRKRKNESNSDYLARQDALKRLWGPPFRLNNIHPLAMFTRIAAGARLTEVIEHSWKLRRDVYPGLDVDANDRTPDPETLAAASGFPAEDIQPLPMGVSTSDMVLATEYWRGDLYQIYVNGQQVHNKENPAVAYFVATGRSSSSKDPDKMGMSVADVLRHTEPHINRTLTRMAEAADKLVKKRLTVELPEGATDEVEMDADNNPVARTFKFDEDVATALPPGAKVHDPFAGVEGIYQAMPFLSMLLQLTARHGVAPIFKGQSPGAAGSGYRDTSLYMMALSQFKHMLNSYAGCIKAAVDWLEDCLVTHVKQRIWVGDLSLDPADIKDFPAVCTVEVEPFLPQNLVAEGHFWDYMHGKGHTTRKMVAQKGLKLEDYEQIELARMLEDIQELLKPLLYKDVLTRLGVLEEAPEVPGSEGELQNKVVNVIGGLGGQGGSGSTGDRTMAGLPTGGQGRNPPNESGSYPPGQENRYQGPPEEPNPTGGW